MELETERLRRRRWRDDDLPTLARWNADPIVMRHMGRGPMTLEESAAALDRYRRHWDEHGFGVIGAQRLVSICTEGNLESRRVMEKLGFRLHEQVPFEELGITLWVHALDAK
ncbi:MAG TPA: GNAT family N-acetyltransferase [Gaiellaceae bacterium]|nr:GNAT family N-acetyltransferase [Gaiellaceae bacterium]